MQPELNTRFDMAPLLEPREQGRSIIRLRKDDIIYSQGDTADAIYYLQSGSVKLTVTSDNGKEAVVALLRPGAFFGESCLTRVPKRHTSATAMTRSVITKISKNQMLSAIREQTGFAEFLLSYLLSRNINLESDLVDQLCNSCEKRLVRVLLSLTHFGQSAGSATVQPRINQGTLAAMVGTTQPRISFLLNKLRKDGFIEYGEKIQVNSSLLETLPQGLRPKAGISDINSA